jgi:beta-N-acetylhexosaminidase
VTDLIRDKWGYRGIVVTDDFVMGPIYEHGVCNAVVEALNAGVDLILVAYDGLQFYRMYNCAWAAPKESIDEAMLQRSAARLDSRVLKHEASTQTPASQNSRN